MKLRTQILIIIGVTILSGVVSLSLVANKIFLSRFEKLEQEMVLQNLNRLQDAVHEDAKQVAALGGDWGAWDDTRKFILGNNDQFIADYLDYLTLLGLNMDFMLFVDLEGNPIQSCIIDRAQESAGVMAAPDIQRLRTLPGSVGSVDAKDQNKFSLNLSDGPALLAVSPITSNDRTAPVCGFLIVGRFLDEEALANISARIHLDLHWFRLDRDLSPQQETLLADLIEADGPIVTPLDDNVISGYRLILDVDGQPIFVFRIDMPRTVLQQGIISLRYYMLSILLIAIGVIGVVFVFLHFTLLKPIRKLIAHTVAIRDTDDLSLRLDLPGHGEFATLAGELNTMVASLRESRDRLGYALESAKACFWEWQVASDQLKLSPQICLLLGYEPQAAPSSYAELQNLLHAEDRLAFARLFEHDQVAREETFRTECRLKTREGQWKWILATAKVVEREADGQPRRLVGMFIDISKRKQAEAEVRDKELQLKQIFEYLPTGIILIDPETHTVVDVNTTAANMFGAQKNEVIGQGCHSFFCLGSEGKCPITDEGKSEGRLMERVAFKANGEKVTVLKRVVWLERDGRKLLLESFIDITQQKQMEEAHSRLIAAVDYAAEDIFMTDVEGQIVYVNPAFEKNTGYSREEALGQNPRFLNSGKHDKEFYEKLWQTLKRGDIWVGQITNKCKDGRLLKESAKISPVYDKGRELIGYVSVKRDVTREVALETKLRQAQKMEAIGTLAGGIAHDFNNILCALIGYADLSMNFTPKEDRIYKYLNEIRKAGYRAKDLVRQILAFSRQTEQDRRPIQMQNILTEAIRLLRGSLPSTIEIRSKIDVDSLPVVADPTQIHQVIMNLCTNAFHAMGSEGGILGIELGEMDISAERAMRFVGLDAGRHLCLTVSDTGHGIPFNNLQRIFEPYFTTKRQGEGTGLGLSMVHGIIKSHGGDISVYSEIGTGTTFRIYFPICARNEEADVEETRKYLDYRGSERILFVDDEETITQLILEGLKGQGYDVTIRTNGVEALEAFRGAPDRYDFVISDQTMPHMTGLQLAENIRGLRPDIPIIICSGFSEMITEEKIKALKINAYIHKPLIVSDIAREVRRIMAQRSPVPSQA